MADSNSGSIFKPETLPKILIIAAIAIIFKMYVLQWALDFATETLHLAIELGALAVIGFIAFSRKSRVFFNVLCQVIASAFVAVFPLQVMEETLNDSIKKRELANKNLGVVKGVMTKTQDKIQEYKDKAEHAFNQGQYYKGQGQMNDAGSAAAEGNQYLQAIKDLQPSLDQETRTYERMSKLWDNSGYVIKYMKTQLEINKDKNDLLSAGSNIVKQMSAIYDADSDNNKMWNQGLVSLQNDFAAKAGMIDRFYETSNEVSKSIDADKGANMIQGLNLLDQFEKSGDIEMLLNPHSMDTTISLPSASAPKQLANNGGSSKYDSLVNN